MKQYDYNPKNPLVKYYRELARESVGLKLNIWNLVSARSNIHIQTIISIARMDKEKVNRMTVGIYKKLKDKLGVDMLDYK